MRVIGSRYQRTLAAPAELRGVGFITGARVRVRLLPAPADTGIVFRRFDLPGSPAVPARAAHITDSHRRTTLGQSNAAVTLTEHVMAALAGLRIDNCTIELDGPEPPGLDGSAMGFVQVLAAAGAALQRVPRAIWTVERPLIVRGGGSAIALHPGNAPTLRVTYFLDYGLAAPIGRQTFTLDCCPENFVCEVAACRTFLTEPEARALRTQGIGKHLTPADVLVFGPHGPIDSRLRFADEPARHKVLDILGDLALCGFDLAGHVVAYRSGHALNAELARRLTLEAESAQPGVMLARAA